jgi:hypothetical protein
VRSFRTRTGRPPLSLEDLILSGTLRLNDPRHRQLLAKTDERPPAVPPIIWAHVRRRAGLSYNPARLIPWVYDERRT